MNHIINRIWMLVCSREYSKFLNTLSHVEEFQENILLSILDKNSNTIFGKKHGFSKIETIMEFQEKIPISDYEDYLPSIKDIASGKENVLTSEPVLMLEPSSGTTSPSKYIPYTKNLKNQFQRAVKVWLYDLYQYDKRLLSGTSYWSISPVVNTNQEDNDSIQKGFEEDTEYFGTIGGFLLKQLLPVPNELKQVKDIDAFRYITLLFLLKEKYLSFISVWNPTFLTLLLSPFEEWKDSLINDLKKGSIHIPKGTLPAQLKNTLTQKLGKNIRRSNEIKSIVRMSSSPNIWFEKIWPNLALISCWTAGHSRPFISFIENLFPNTKVQGKGLIATEGIVSFPLNGYDGQVLAMRSHFFEFIEYGKERNEINVKLASELETGCIYSVVITTGGGLYRYQLNDLIRVLGFMDQCPIIEFMGKEESISDYFGEKINEHFVTAVLGRALKKHDIETEFHLIAPEVNQNGHSFYTLFVKPNHNQVQPAHEVFLKLVLEIENGLNENFHYKNCRHLGQLQPLRLFFITDKNPTDIYLKYCAKKGQRLGDIKPAVLHQSTEWAKVFQGNYLS